MKNLIIYFILALPFVVQAQHSVSGTVSDNLGQALSGVNIYVKGSEAGGEFIGTISDDEGYYELNVPNQQDTLVYSYIGYDVVEIAISGEATMNITLGESTNELDQVIVVGYGVQRKRVATGAISSLKSDQIEGFPGAGCPNIPRGPGLWSYRK